jgi:hypothetical protein
MVATPLTPLWRLHTEEIVQIVVGNRAERTPQSQSKLFPRNLAQALLFGQ